MSKTFKNLLGVLFLSLALLASQIPGTTSTAASALSTDFLIRSGTLVQYTGTADTVSVPDAVDKIAEGAFKGNSYLQTLTIPSSVKEIADAAFSDCTNLSKVTVQGDGLTKFGAGVFAGCTSLKEVSFADSSSFSCEDGVIYGKDQTVLEEVLPASGITLLVLGSNVTEIEEFAAWGVNTLKTVSIGNSVKKIPAYAFASCVNLTSVSLPGRLTNIGMKAFADDVNLTNIVVPVTTKVHETAFDGCISLSDSAVENAEYEDTDGIGMLVTDDGNPSSDSDVSGNDISGNEQGDANQSGEQHNGETETQEGDEGTSSDSEGGSSDGTISYSIKAPGESLATSKIVGGRAVLFVNNSEATVYGAGMDNEPSETDSMNEPDASGAVDGTDQGQTVASNSMSLDENGDVTDTDMLQTISNALVGSDEKGVNIPKYTITNNRVAGQAFYFDNELTEYTIPSGVTGIGNFAFARSALQQITIPQGVTEIGYAAFYHCDSLTTVSIPNSVTKIANYAFNHTPWLDAFYANAGSNDDYLIVGDGILLAYRGSDSIAQIPNGVKHIAAGAFADHQGLTGAVMPDSLLTIEEEAFRGCPNLTNVSLNEGLLKIADRAFADSNISKIVIPSTVTEIGLKAFGGNADCAALFLGTSLPTVSSEESSSRLSNKEYRDYAMGDFGIILISDQIGADSLSGTLADEQELGFAGYVLTYADASGGEATPLKLINNGEDRTLPTQVLLQDHSFSVHQQNVESVDSCRQDTAQSVKVLSSSTALGETNDITAVIPGTNEMYVLHLRDSDLASQAIAKAYQISYGSDLPEANVVIDASLYDQTDNVPIVKLGKQEIEITLSVPEALSVNGTLHVLTTDADGQLEELDYTADVPDADQTGNVRITVYTNHFSPICFYNYSEAEGEVAGVVRVVSGKLIYTDGSAKLDDTPDTGDLIHPKWFLVIGFVFAGLTCFLLPSRKKKVR